MQLLRLFRTRGPVDLELIRRDAMLGWLPLLPLLVALLVRWGTPSLKAWLAFKFQFALEPLYPLIASFFIMLMPAFSGLIAGFLLLDERDEGTLTALLVTPISLHSYLVYRVAAPIVMSVGISLITVPLVGLVRVPFLTLLLIALLASLTAPMMALYLAVFAENKVAGFALAKSVGGIVMIPLATFFVQADWQVAVGVIPTYWPLKTFWLAVAERSEVWLYFALGVAVNLVVLVLFLRHFDRVMHR